MRLLPNLAKKFASKAVAQEPELVELTTAEENRPPALPFPFPFMSFTYTCSEISSVDGHTRVRTRQSRLVDGKLQSQELDVTLDGGAYVQAMAETQRLLAEQTVALMRPFTFFLPFFGKK